MKNKVNFSLEWSRKNEKRKRMLLFSFSLSFCLDEDHVADEELGIFYVSDRSAVMKYVHKIKYW